jgi:hypothetical protein
MKRVPARLAKRLSMGNLRKPPSRFAKVLGYQPKTTFINIETYHVYARMKGLNNRALYMGRHDDPVDVVKVLSSWGCCKYLLTARC